MLAGLLSRPPRLAPAWRAGGAGVLHAARRVPRRARRRVGGGGHEPGAPHGPHPRHRRCRRQQRPGGRPGHLAAVAAGVRRAGPVSGAPGECAAVHPFGDACSEVAAGGRCRDGAADCSLAGAVQRAVPDQPQPRPRASHARRARTLVPSAGARSPLRCCSPWPRPPQEGRDGMREHALPVHAGQPESSREPRAGPHGGAAPGPGVHAALCTVAPAPAGAWNRAAPALSSMLRWHGRVPSQDGGRCWHLCRCATSWTRKASRV